MYATKYTDIRTFQIMSVCHLYTFTVIFIYHDINAIKNMCHKYPTYTCLFIINRKLKLALLVIDRKLRSKSVY